MHRTEGFYHNANMFTNGPPGTRLEENWLNSIQEELAYVIEQAGLTLETASTDTREQLKNAIDQMIYNNSGDDDSYITWDGDAFDIQFDFNDTIKFDGSGSSISISITETGNAFSINPETDDYTSFYFGSNTIMYDNFYVKARTQISLLSEYSGTLYSTVYTSASSTESSTVIYAENGSDSSSIFVKDDEISITSDWDIVLTAGDDIQMTANDDIVLTSTVGNVEIQDIIFFTLSGTAVADTTCETICHNGGDGGCMSGAYYYSGSWSVISCEGSVLSGRNYQCSCSKPNVL